MFIDPEEEKKTQKEREKHLNKKEAPQIKLKNGTVFSMQSTLPAGQLPPTGARSQR